MDNNPYQTQHDVGSAVVAELRAAGFDDGDEIGHGGFGIVYRCTQIALDRTVAIKVLTTDLDQNRDRFLREQRAMGQLTGHPNIVGVLQVGETGSGRPYLVMQYHRQGSIAERIRKLGVLPVPEVLRLGVKMAGALEAAHRVGILHRDVKPANILLTDFGEPALSDFGIAHISDGFKTASGVFTGSPAFTAPEVLAGDPPSREADVYGLGATLFAALTGHAAFERRSGEELVAQFLRVTSEPVPDLRTSGIPDDVAALVGQMMARDPSDRPSLTALGETLRQLQVTHSSAVDAAAAPDGSGHQVRSVPRTRGNLPTELTSFVGRGDDLSAVQHVMSTARLVTLTGPGGVGKTRLALRAAAEATDDFADGTWLVELGELRDPTLLVDIVAASLGLRDQSSQSLVDTLVESLSTRQLLLILDNCEHVVDATAKLAELLLRACPGLRILTTSRETLGIGGETVVRLDPLGLDAVALFADRAAAALPGFELNADNTPTVRSICAKVEGLPLAIELAAARLRALSPDQILARLDDRYALLTRGTRGAPKRQETLSWSVGWSYDLCTQAEQQLWAQLSVFAGTFDLQAAEEICRGELARADILDVLSALVDKSVLIRTESEGAVRFRLLETLRDYGRQQIAHTDRYAPLRHRHADWYRHIVRDARDDWFSPRQQAWINRIETEGPNIRAALSYSVIDAPDIALDIAGAFHIFAIVRGALTEARHWLDRALDASPPEPTPTRIAAIYSAAFAALLQGDAPAAGARVAEGHRLTEQMTDHEGQAMIGVVAGFTNVVGGEFEYACTRLESALSLTADPALTVTGMLLLGWAYEFRDDLTQARIWQGKALDIAKSHGETVYRLSALWSLGINWWHAGDTARAAPLLVDAAALAHQINDLRQGAACVEGLAWISAHNGEYHRAAVLLATAQALGRRVGTSTVLLPHLQIDHDRCARRIREELSAEDLHAANVEGGAMNFGDAVRYATTGSLVGPPL